VELQEGVEVIDALGGRSQTWPAFGTDWAAIDNQPFIVSETQAAVLYQVTVRFRQDVIDRFDAGTQIRVVGGGRTVKVLAIVNPEQRNIELVLHCGDALQ
jgi:head-tail adaptor